MSTQIRLVRKLGIDGRVYTVAERSGLERMSESAKQQMIHDMNRSYGEWYAKLTGTRESYSSKYF